VSAVSAGGICSSWARAIRASAAMQAVRTCPSPPDAAFL